MIRDAVIDDIPGLVVSARKFADAIGAEKTVGFDEATVTDLLAHLIENEAGFVLVTEGGAVGGLVHPSMFNRNHLTGSELFWWVDPERRGAGLKLFSAMENAAKARGAQSWMVSTMEALKHSAAGKFYERCGYSPSDRNYIKRF